MRFAQILLKLSWNVLIYFLHLLDPIASEKSQLHTRLDWTFHFNRYGLQILCVPNDPHTDFLAFTPKHSSNVAISVTNEYRNTLHHTVPWTLRKGGNLGPSSNSKVLTIKILQFLPVIQTEINPVLDETRQTLITPAIGPPPQQQGSSRISGVRLPSASFLLRVTQVLMQTASSIALRNLGPLQRKDWRKSSRTRLSALLQPSLWLHPSPYLEPIFRCCTPHVLGTGVVSAP